jgi:uncharacterized membrane protein YkgB
MRCTRRTRIAAIRIGARRNEFAGASKRNNTRSRRQPPIVVAQAVLLTAGAFVPILSAVGSLMEWCVCDYVVVFLFEPGAVKWSVSTDPIAWNLTGEFLYKDVVLLCVCIVLFLASLPKKVVPLRSTCCDLKAKGTGQGVT